LAQEHGVLRIARQWPIVADQIRTPGAELIYGEGNELIQRENGVSYSRGIDQLVPSKTSELGQVE